MRGKVGSITGTMTAGENIIETIAEKERSATKKYTNSAGFSILKMAVSAAPGTKFAFNGADIILPSPHEVGRGAGGEGGEPPAKRHTFA